MADTRYNRFDNQSPVETQLRADDVSVGRSAHDFSFIQNGTALIGALFPFKPIWYVPNEDIDISMSAVFEFRNPTTRQLYNGFRVFIHAYQQDITDLWEGARNWIDQGRSGKINIPRPSLIWRATSNPLNLQVDSNSPLGLISYFGIPSACVQTTYFGLADGLPPIRWFQTCFRNTTVSPVCNYNAYNYSPNFLPADLFFMYQKIWRDYYCNKNLLQNNKYWFPDNEDHFILSYSCSRAVCINYENEDFHKSETPDVAATNQLCNLIGSGDATNYSSVTPEPNNPTTVPPVSYTSIYYAPNLSGLKFRQFRGDRFTTALPFPDLIRGDIPILQATQDAISLVSILNTQGKPGAHVLVENSLTVPSHAEGRIQDPNFLGYYNNTDSTQTFAFGRLGIKLGSLGVTQSDLYTLETLTAFRRRMALTNGDFNQSIKAQFGISPKIHDRKAHYIGGFYQDFAMSTVTQTSQSDSSPLGTRAGQGISSGNGSIGHVHTTNFGWIMFLCSIVPDVYYTQGLDRQFSIKDSMQLYFPIFNNLPAQAILNKELYVSGDSSIDDDVFAWEDRYAEFKSSRNVVCGLMALPVSLARFDTARIIARRFSSTPVLNSLFITMVPENIDMSPFTVTDEPPFDFSVSVNVRRVFPGPYAAIEGSLSSPALVRG